MLSSRFGLTVGKCQCQHYEKMETYGKSEEEAPEFFFCKKIDTEHLITMLSATFTLFLSYTLTSKSEKLCFPSSKHRDMTSLL